MKISFFILLLLSANCMYACSSVIETPVVNSKDTTSIIPVDPSYNIDIKDFKLRDPFVFVDTLGKCYYVHANSNDNQSLTVYKSKDLKKWKNLGKSFIASSEFWGKQDFWAPDMFEFNGKYYIAATFSATGIKRGCSILASYTPEGPYTPLINETVTPKGWVCLDATIFIDKGQPYLLYSREWLEVIDGEIYIQKLSQDFKTTVGEPMLLFRASSAPWVGDISAKGVTGKVTDSPFLYRVSDTELLMFWSSFTKSTGKYCIGVAHSSSGSITGPWVQETAPLNTDDGGHAMVFKTLEGQLKISYHSPNSAPNYVTICDLDIFNGKINIVK